MNKTHATVRRVITLLSRPIIRYVAKKKINGLIMHRNQQIRSIATALNNSFEKKFTAEDKKFISLIESRRAALLSSTEEISVIDYGAGSSDTKRLMQEMQNGVRSRALVSKVARASKKEFWARMLFSIVREVKPTSCIELGSCVGISAAYMASAQKLYGNGTVVTLEGSDEIAELAKETLASIGLENSTVVVGPFHETLDGVLESSRPIDFLFNDGHHDHDAVLDYFERSLPFLADSAVVVFDDICWSEGMRAAWSLIEKDARVFATFDLGAVGIALVDKSLNTKEVFKIKM